MQILSEVSKSYILDSLTAPIGVSHFWTLNATQLDFMLEKLEYIEETTGKSVVIRCQNLDIVVPASWQVLSVDRDTSSIDCVPIARAAAMDYDVLLFSPDDAKVNSTKLQFIDFINKASVYHPMIPKGCAMVHPTGPELSHNRSIFFGIVIGPHDLNRWIGGKTVGEILV
jgi:hypothetical protein